MHLTIFHIKKGELVFCDYAVAVRALSFDSILEGAQISILVNTFGFAAHKLLNEPVACMPNLHFINNLQPFLSMLIGKRLRH